ncbi:MAG: glycolate oxidase subunit GlcE [Gammaproteobacteria bacterium]|jgi:glycolate oxidase FAD binding subunit
MADHFKPDTPEQVCEAVAWAVAEETPLEIVSSGSKRAMGRPTNIETRLDVSALRGISLYEPEELVLSAGPGTPMAEIEQTLAERRQQLAFEPADLGPLLGLASGGGTLGGAIACNLSGPRRIKAGAARDHFLGFTAVSGRGETFKSGGRVVKNVTGYDLSKLMCGAWGTLGVMTSLTVKVLPMAESIRTVLVLGIDPEEAGEAMTAAMRTPYEVSGAAWLPASLASKSGVSYVANAKTTVAAIRIEGPKPSVEYRCAALRRQLGEMGETEELHGHNSVRFWQEVRDVIPFATKGDGRCVWRLSVPPAEGAATLERLAVETGGDSFLDWGGGLIWLAVDGGDDACHDAVRGAMPAAGGHATLIRAPETVRAAVPVFQPPSAGVARLSRSVKENFDPRGVLNPGRMYAGM